MNDKVKRPLTNEEREYINKYLQGNVKKSQERRQRYEEIVGLRNDCLDEVAELDKLPGAEDLKQQLTTRINQIDVLKVQPDDFKKAKSELEKISKEVHKALVKFKSTGLAKQQIENQNATLQKVLPFDKGRAEQFEKEVSRGLLHGGAGPKFKKVTAAMKEVEKDPSEKNLAALEKAAKDYLNGLDEGETGDEKRQRKVQICNEALVDVANLRKYGKELAQLKPPPWSGAEEAKVRDLQVRMLLDHKPAAKLGAGVSGASESFFIPGKDGNNAFLFKPGDGESVAGIGWEEGGGVPREVLVSRVNETLKESGLDCGVSPTSLVKVKHDSLATQRNGNKSERVGAIQSFVPSSGKPFSDYCVPGSGRKDRLNVPTADIHKVMVLDFVTLQLDRNDGNFLMQDGPDGQGRLVPIDAGNAMPGRDAFESKRRIFTAGALFGVEQADEPFDPEALAGIDNMDPDKLAASMKQAKLEMAELDPQTPQKVDDESIEMVRRSAMFLKQAVGRLKTPAAVGVAYQYCLQKVFAAPAQKLQDAIENAIKETLERIRLFDEQEKLQQINPSLSAQLFELGWPTSDEFVKEDPAYVLDIIKKKRPNPAALRVIDESIEALGGMAEARKLLPKLDTMPLHEKIRAVHIELRNFRLKPHNLLAKLGGDELLRQAGQDPSQMDETAKLKQCWEIVYAKEGGDTERDRLVAMGFKRIPSAKNGAGPMEWAQEIQDWKEYLRLGGDRQHLSVGGTGHPGVGETPSSLLANLKLLQGLYDSRVEEVRHGLQAATNLIANENGTVQQFVNDAKTLFGQATDMGTDLLQAVRDRNAVEVARLLQEIESRSLRLETLARNAKTESQRIEDAFYKLLPTLSEAERVGQKDARQQVEQNGVYRIINDLTGERQPLQNYVRWLQDYKKVGANALRGQFDVAAAYRPLLLNEFRKLALQQFPLIHAAASRLGTVNDGVEERLKAATKNGATGEALLEIKGRIDQMAVELPQLNQTLQQFERNVLRAQALLTQEVRQIALQRNGKNEENEILSQNVRDIDRFTPTVTEFRNSANDLQRKLQKYQDQYQQLQANQPNPQPQPTGTTDTTNPQVQGDNPETGTDTPPQQPQPQPQRDDGLVPDELEPAEPLILSMDSPNPTLYFHPNTAGGKNFIVHSGHPGGQWAKVEQFCAYMATHWLANNQGQGNLKFSGLPNKDDAINTVAQWGDGGLNAQVDHAANTLGGQRTGKGEVLPRARQGGYPKGTRIWFGTDAHAQGAYVRGPGLYAVYDPDTGASQTMTGPQFADYAAGANAFVVA